MSNPPTACERSGDAAMPGSARMSQLLENVESSVTTVVQPDDRTLRLCPRAPSARIDAPEYTIFRARHRARDPRHHAEASLKLWADQSFVPAGANVILGITPRPH